MARKRVETKYGKARTSPSKRNGVKAPGSYKVPMNKPKGESEISQFVAKGRADGESSIDLIRQFQLAECKHSRQRVVIAEGPTKRLLRCPDCGHIKEGVVKPR